MKIQKMSYGTKVQLELKKIKDYPRYSLYQVYKIENGKQIPIYKECYTDLQIIQLILNGKIIDERDDLNVCG